MIESPPTEPAATPSLHVDLAQVCVVDGVWQDVPDHIAAFEDERLIATASPEELAAARTRGNLYIVLDVSGEVEGRSEVERELIETIRREYSKRRGSITFGLSEALRAANAALFDLNLPAPRETRRMAGVSAVVLRGDDLYVAQAGPAVVYVEVNGHLHRYPAESDWFTEDAPLISPQGNASPPLGVRREFACDLFHTTAVAGDVFVIATRGLTQMASTEELAHAFENRGAEDISAYLEEASNGSDLSALVAELVDPRDLAGEKNAPDIQPEEQSELEPESESDLELDEEAETEPEEAPADVAPQPAFASQAMALPAPALMSAPGMILGAEEPAEPVESQAERLAQLREERRLRREQQIGAVGHAFAGMAGAVIGTIALFTRAIRNVLGIVDWQAVKVAVNNGLNLLFLAGWNALSLIVRLMLPGATTRQAIIPRRTTKEPIWLKGMAILLPVLFIVLAVGAAYSQSNHNQTESTALVLQAEGLLRQAILLKDTDRAGAMQQVDQARPLIQQIRDLGDPVSASGLASRIADLTNELNGITVLSQMAVIARLTDVGTDIGPVVADDNDIYFLDRGAMRIYHYRTNDSGTRSDPASGDGIVLQVGTKIGNITVDQIHDMAWADSIGTAAHGGLVTVTGNAVLFYDPTATTWQAYPLVDAAQWGDIRAMASFLGNIYLLDATKNQVWKYVTAVNGYAPAAVPYLPANSSVDLTHAVDVAIDGDVWVLTDTGRVLRLRMGQRQSFDWTGLDVPLNNPAAIYTRAGVDNLYIADAGNQRIVEFDKNGRYLHQYKPRSVDGDAFSGIKTLFVSQSKRKFYLVSGNQVMQADIP
ncbi:MAG: hypothetical protein WCF84_25690 [Anaerolineae bacterium]